MKTTIPQNEIVKVESAGNGKVKYGYRDFFIVAEYSEIRIYSNEQEDRLIIIDKDNNIKHLITADCGQNQGFFKIKDFI